MRDEFLKNLVLSFFDLMWLENKVWPLRFNSELIVYLYGYKSRNPLAKPFGTSLRACWVFEDSIRALSKNSPRVPGDLRTLGTNPCTSTHLSANWIFVRVSTTFQTQFKRFPGVQSLRSILSLYYFPEFSAQRSEFRLLIRGEEGWRGGEGKGGEGWRGEEVLVDRSR